MKMGSSENKLSALELSSSLIPFSFISSFMLFQQTFIQHYKIQFGSRKEVNDTGGKKSRSGIWGKFRLWSNALLKHSDQDGQ